MDRLRLFGIGLSWGGYESLILPGEPRIARSVRPCAWDGRLLRIHAGLEAAHDLIADLRQAFGHAARLWSDSRGAASTEAAASSTSTASLSPSASSIHRSPERISA